MTVRNLYHQNYDRNQHQLAQREFNREKAEFNKAKQELTGIRSERREGIEQRGQLQNARENAQNQLARAEQTGDAAQINLAQQRLAEKSQNLAALNLRLHNLNGRLTETAAEVKAERKEMMAARRELNETLTPEIKREQSIRKDVNNALGGLKVQVENGEPIGIFRDQVRKSLFNNTDVPISANLSDEAALKIARQRAESPYFKAEKEARMELVKSGAESVTKSYTYEHRVKQDRGYDRRTEEGKVEVSVRFTEKSRISEFGRNNEQPASARKVTREDVERIKSSEIKKMKTELAETGAESLKRNIELADGRTLQLEVNADWQAEESVKISTSSGDRRDSYEWKSYSEAKTNRSSRNDDGGIDLPPSARLQGAEDVKKIAAEKAKTAGRLQEQLLIQGYIAQSRLEAVQSGETDGFKDRKIIGKNVYEVNVEAKFDIDTKRLNPNELNSVERQIQNNPTLSREQIVQMRENFAKGLEQAKGAMIQTLKEGLALSGDRVAEGTFTYRGEQHKVTVKADWEVDAELHRTPDKPDVERYVREMLLQNGGKEIAGKFFNHNAKGSADFDLDSRQLRSPKPSEVEMLDLRKANLSPAEYELLKNDIDTRTKFDLSAAAQDMLNDLARTGDKELKRVVTTSTGERHELTVKADWDVDVKKIDQLKMGIIQGLKMVGMMAAIVGTAGAGTPLAGTMAAIGAGANVVSSGLQGDWLGAGIGALGMAGGIIGGSLGQTLQFGARAANTARGLADGNFSFTDALSVAGTAGAGLQLLGASTNSIDAVKIGDKLLDLEKYGGYVDSALRGDGEGVFMAVATELIGSAARFRKTQEANNPRPSTNGGERGNNQFGTTDELLNALGNPEKLAKGLRDGSIRAGITDSLRDGVFNDDLNRVRQTYNGIYRSMDERGRAALDLIDSNARRRGIDPMVARAQVNNLLTEMSDLPQLIRNNAARRGLPVEYSERIISGLLRESGRDVDLATILDSSKANSINQIEKIKDFGLDTKNILKNINGLDSSGIGDLLNISFNSRTVNSIVELSRRNPAAALNTLINQLEQTTNGADVIRQLVTNEGGRDALVTILANSGGLNAADRQLLGQAVGRFFDFSNGRNQSFISDLLERGALQDSQNARGLPEARRSRLRAIGLIAQASGNSNFVNSITDNAIRLANRHGLSSYIIAAIRASENRGTDIQAIIPRISEQQIEQISRYDPQSALIMLRDLPAPTADNGSAIFNAYKLFRNVAAGNNSNNQELSRMLSTFYRNNVESIGLAVGYAPNTSGQLTLSRLNNLTDFFANNVFVAGQGFPVGQVMRGTLEYFNSSYTAAINGQGDAESLGRNAGLLLLSLRNGYNAASAAESEKRELISGVASTLAAEGVGAFAPVGADTAAFVTGLLLDRLPNQVNADPSNSISVIILEVQNRAASVRSTNPQLANRLTQYVRGLQSALGGI